MLSRDDEDGDDGDDTASESYLPGGLSEKSYSSRITQDYVHSLVSSSLEISCNFLLSFFPRAEDLMSLLDADIHSAHPSVIIDADAMFSEDISYFGYPSFRRSSLSRLGPSRGNSTTHLCLMERGQGVGQALVTALVMAFFL